MKKLWVTLFVIFCFSLFLGAVFAANNVTSVNTQVFQETGSNLHIVCDSGCSGISGFADATSFTAGTTPVNIAAGIYNDALTLSSGQAGAVRLTANREMRVVCDSGCTGGSGAVDEAAFTQGTTSFNPIGGLYATSITNLTAGQAGVARLTTDRMLFVNIGDIGGNPVVTGTGTSGNGIPRVTVSSDSSITANAGTNLNTSLLALDTSVNGILNSQGSSTSGEKGALILGAVTTSAPSYTTAQSSPISLDTAGNLRINCVTGCSGGSGGTSAVDEAAFTQGTTSYTPLGGLYATSVTNLTAGQAGVARLTTDRMLFVNLGDVGGSAIATAATGIIKVGLTDGGGSVINSTSGALNVQVSGPFFVDNTAFTYGTSTSSNIGCVYNSSITNLTSGNAGVVSCAPNRSIITANMMSGTTPGTAPAWTAITGGIYNSSAPSPTNGQTLPMQMDSSGRVIVNCGSGCGGSGGTSIADNAAFTQGTTSETPMGALYTTSYTSCTSGNSCIPQITIDGMLFTNLQKMNGVTVLMGNGTSGTGSQRVNLASDNTAIANWGQGATGSAVPSGAVYLAGNGSGNLTGQVVCDKNVILNAFSTSGSTQEVAASGSTKVYICGFTVNSSSTTAVTAKLVYGTGTNCATSPSDLSVAVPLQAVASSAPVGQNVVAPSNVVWATPASQAVCINLSAAQAVDAQFWYTQF